MKAEPCRVLFVCLGNICRSPAAEGVFRHLAAKESLPEAAVCDSCGTAGWHTGNLADARMRAAAERRGYALTRRARALRAEDFERFDLILTMDEENLANVLERCPRNEWRSKVKPFAAYCRESRPGFIPDPYYGGAEGFEQVLDLLEEGCAALIAELGGGK